MLSLIILLNVIFSITISTDPVEVIGKPQHSNVTITGNTAHINHNSEQDAVHLKVTNDLSKNSVHIKGTGTNGKGDYHIIINPKPGDLLHEATQSMPKPKPTDLTVQTRVIDENNREEKLLKDIPFDEIASQENDITLNEFLGYIHEMKSELLSMNDVACLSKHELKILQNFVNKFTQILHNNGKIIDEIEILNKDIFNYKSELHHLQNKYKETVLKLHIANKHRYDDYRQDNTFDGSKPEPEEHVEIPDLVEDLGEKEEYQDTDAHPIKQVDKLLENIPEVPLKTKESNSKENSEDSSASVDGERASVVEDRAKVIDLFEKAVSEDSDTPEQKIEAHEEEGEAIQLAEENEDLTKKLNDLSDSQREDAEERISELELYNITTHKENRHKLKKIEKKRDTDIIFILILGLSLIPIILIILYCCWDDKKEEKKIIEKRYENFDETMQNTNHKQNSDIDIQNTTQNNFPLVPETEADKLEEIDQYFRESMKSSKIASKKVSSVNSEDKNNQRISTSQGDLHIEEKSPLSTKDFGSVTEYTANDQDI